MQVRRADDDHIVLEKGSFRLIVHRIPERSATGTGISVPPAVRENGSIKLSFPVESISRSREIATQVGGCVYDSSENGYEATTCATAGIPTATVFQLFQPTNR